MINDNLVGIGVYTPAEASRLLGVPSRKISRWLKGHEIRGKRYERLWRPQVDIGDDRVYLGFRDLMEMRTAFAFMQAGVSAIMIRKAIEEAKKYVADERPLSTTRFQTDGRSIFLEIGEENDDPQLLDLFKKQYTFKRIVDQSLKGVEFDGIAPARWWPLSKQKKIVLDPKRSFGQPIDMESGVPTAVLASAANTEGLERAARNWFVTPATVKRAVEFEHSLRKVA
ncbi:helix-turn-helix domain-containing protein [Nitratireductor sp. GISD-1A_MAKvit]|uniref:helix-turn-helix domain-containing protein n=1 Tax=Nitratireductor sp. GISD-1A_MAKvit TaxID=3234198 RepID=UPI003466F60D